MVDLTSSLTIGPSVLILEDEHWIADDLATSLTVLGLGIVGPFPKVGLALEALRQGPAPSVAILDVKLSDSDCFAVADQLISMGIPFVFHTGYDRRAIPDRFVDVPLFEKPFDPGRLASLVVAMASDFQPVQPPALRMPSRDLTVSTDTLRLGPDTPPPAIALPT